MKCKGQIRGGAAFLAGLLAFCSAKQAYALFPALDTSSLVQGIEQTITAVKESTVVVNTMETVKKTSAAIGTAKKTVTEYVTDAKKELEETVKKVNEYKKQVEEYVEEVKEFAHKVGYPIILKATAGGGGKGMRVVRSDDELESNLNLCQQEAGNFFGNPDVYA